MDRFCTWYNTWCELIDIKSRHYNVALCYLYVRVLVKVYFCWFCCKYMLYFLLGGILFYYKTLVFVQFLLFLVMIFHFLQYGSNFPIFTCLTLLQSAGKRDIAILNVMILSNYHGNNQNSILRPSQRGKWDIETRDDIMPLPWKQSIFYTLPKSAGRVKHWSTWWYYPITMETVKILCINFL